MGRTHWRVVLSFAFVQAGAAGIRARLYRPPSLRHCAGGTKSHLLVQFSMFWSSEDKGLSVSMGCLCLHAHAHEARGCVSGVLLLPRATDEGPRATRRPLARLSAKFR